MRCAGITYATSENSLAVLCQAIHENWCQPVLRSKREKYSFCTKIPEVVILTFSLKLHEQQFKLLWEKKKDSITSFSITCFI